MRKYMRWSTVVYTAFALIASCIPYYASEEISDASRALITEGLEASLAENRGGTARLIDTPRDALNVRLELIRSANKSIDFVCHTVHAGSSTEAFFGELVAAADRGVQVRILLDAKAGAGSKQVRRWLEAMDRHENIKYRRYNEVSLLRPWEWHALLHDKFILVDQALLLLGGRNMGDRYYGPADYTGEIVQDFDVLASGQTITRDVEAYMDELWEHEETVAAKPKDRTWRTLLDELLAGLEAFETANPDFYHHTLHDYVATMVEADRITLLHNPTHTSRKDPWVASTLLELTRDADRVLLSTPYATANPNHLSALKRLGETADLAIVTNSMVSSPNFPAFSNYYFERDRFLETGASIFEYHGEGSLHAKALLIDSHLSAVGSLNMDDRSFYIDTESMLLIDSPAFARQLTEVLEHQMDESYPYTIEDASEISAPEAPFMKRLLMQVSYYVFRPFAYLL